MYLPLIQLNNNKTLILQNYLRITDTSTSRKSKVLVLCKNGATLEFLDEDADELLDELEKTIDLADQIFLPIVGFDDTFLILPNFNLFEYEASATPSITLTTDTGEEMTFEGEHAALIQARVDTLHNQVEALSKNLLANAQNQNNQGLLN